MKYLYSVLILLFSTVNMNSKNQYKLSFYYADLGTKPLYATLRITNDTIFSVKVEDEGPDFKIPMALFEGRSVMKNNQLFLQDSMYGIDIIGTIHENGDLSFNPDSNIRVFNNVIFEYGGVEYEEADTMLSFKELFYSDRRREKIVSSLDSLKLTNYNKVIQDGTYYLNYSYGIDINLAIIIRNNVFDYYVYGRHFFSGICTKEEGITYLKKDNFSSELIINNDTSFYCTKLPYLMPFTLDRCLFKKETNLIKK